MTKSAGVEMNNTLKKPTVGDYMNAARSREVGIALMVQPEDLKDFESNKPKRLPFTKFARFDSPMNVFDIMVDLTKSEKRILAEMSHSLAWPDYVATVDLVNITKTQKNEKYRVLRALIKKNLIRKVDAGKYMFNPKFVLQSRHIEEQAAVREWAHHSSP